MSRDQVRETQGYTLLEPTQAKVPNGATISPTRNSETSPREARMNISESRSFSEKNSEVLSSKKHWCGCQIIDPNNSRVVEKWDLILFFALVITAIVTPFEVAFIVPKLDLLFCVDRVIDLIFTVDMFLQFVLMYENPQHPSHMVKDPALIAKNYLRSWFCIDFLSVLPIDTVCVAVGTDSMEKYAQQERTMKTVRLLRLIRLLRLARFARLAQRWHTSFGTSYSVIALFQFIVVILVCCHWMACVWGGLGFALYHADPEDLSWIRAIKIAKGGPDGTYDDTANIYMLSLYWSVVTITSIGYGDICPQAPVEYVIATICMSVMAAAWAYVIGAVCGIVATLDPHTVRFKQTMDGLNQLMDDRQIPLHMRRTLRGYVHEARNVRRREDDKDIVSQMSPMLQGQISMLMNQKWLSDVWYLKKLKSDVIVQISRELDAQLFAPSEPIHEDRKLFIVERGICWYRGRIISQGSIWGEDMILNHDDLRLEHYVRTLSYLEVLTLTREKLDRVTDENPECQPIIRACKVRMVVCRGAVKLAKLIQSEVEKADLKWTNMSEQERMQVIGEVALMPAEATKSTDVDMNEIVDKKILPHTDHLKQQMSDFLVRLESKQQAEDDVKQQMAAVVARVDGLSREIQTMSGKLDGILESQKGKSRK